MASLERPARSFTTTPLTPAEVPRGAPVTDPPESWAHPTFSAAHFAIEEPHWYAYQLEVPTDATAPMRALAHGDLDGDGVTSTFERRARKGVNGYEVLPELRVVAELE